MSTTIKDVYKRQALAMLYGKGDFTNSVDIATRCGQDSDCNPSTVGGVLGVMYGYDKIPSFWLNPLKEVWCENFSEPPDIDKLCLWLNGVCVISLRCV